MEFLLGLIIFLVGVLVGFIILAYFQYTEYYDIRTLMFPGSKRNPKAFGSWHKRFFCPDCQWSTLTLIHRSDVCPNCGNQYNKSRYVDSTVVKCTTIKGLYRIILPEIK